MRIQTRAGTTRSGRTRFAAQGIVAVLAVGGLVMAVAGSAQAATSVGLGTADGFAVLAGSGISNTGATTITGDIGTFPTTSLTGGASITLHGVNHAGDSVTQQAKNDLVTAYGAAAGQSSSQTISADLGGMTLVSGVYTSAESMGLTGTLTLDAAGDPNAAFVFQAGSTLTTASGSQVALINGAQSCNVFWKVGSSATLGTGSTFRGTILALTSVTVTTAVTVDGRVLASNGAVTLDTNTIARSTCTTPPVGDTPTSPPTQYPANVGPGAQGLVCPWGGVYDGVGMCAGTGANSLMNPSPTSTTPTPTSTTPTPTSTTPTPTSTIPTVAQPPTAPAPGPHASPQVPTKPSGGVETGDSTWG
jgi:hypothetical protein